MTELPKTFDPAAIEARWYAYWETTDAFRPPRPDAPPFTIVMPPPNVTGSLHVGHALDVTLQDILVRHARLQGRDALYVAGTDHAGIATQMIVERQLATQGIKRTDMGREAFVERVWDWKAESGGAITQQLRRLGASCDWRHERFTMDEGFSRAVRETFVRMHREGLIYRDKRLVNWDPGLRTAISDLEVETREVQGKFWHFRYPLEDGSGYIAIATTRPETILGDGAVAVSPGDERYAHLVGKRCRLPIVDRLIPIIEDEYVKPDFGSGAVKITPAHDHNDYAVYLRHPDIGMPLINLMNADATMSDTCPPAYRGLDRYVAREKVVAEFAALGLLDKVEDHVHQVPYGDRSGVVIEPWLTDQWYVDAKTLAGPAIDAVRSGAIEVVPATWKKTWFNWLENIQPWCISRQLWWGHRIPAWYADDGRVFVGADEADARAQAGEGVALCQDEDVLDTWFSSALWPFGTLGWPEDSALLTKHYPNDVLVSGFDILFFWDARMAMQGLHLMGKAPWKTLYLHGLVRDATGAKMSKSKGNTVDPIGLIDRYGADALRFTLAAMESQGRDIKLDERRVEGYRNFATKLWNAARFLQGNGVGASSQMNPPHAELTVNRWLIGEVAATVAALDGALGAFRFDEAANVIYHFVWDRFCDWYLELIKPSFQFGVDVETGEQTASVIETRSVAAWAFDQILVMLHPFMPFISEELWHAATNRTGSCIIHAAWPVPAWSIDKTAADDIAWMIRLISAVRAVRTEVSVPPGAKLAAYVLAGTAGDRDPSEQFIGRVGKYARMIGRLARLDSITFLNTGVRINLVTAAFENRLEEPSVAPTGVQTVVDDATYLLGLEGIIDLDAERARLVKATASVEKERDALAARLGNASFVERAKPEAIAKARADHADKSAEAERLRAALTRLG